MPPLNIYKASAGSGKTFALTLDYLSLLFNDPKAYRHILAVTFTNKAAGEMKERILGRLHELSQPGSELMEESRQLVRRTGLSPEEIRVRSGQLLRSILNDYTAFSVGTIDRFFQSVIRAFTREVGIQPAYNLELDSNRVLSVAVDRMFQGLGENRELQDWLLRFAENRLSEDRGWNPRSEMIKLGEELFKENFQSLFDYQNLDDLGRSALAGLRKQLTDLMKESEDKVKAIAAEGIKVLDEQGLEPSTFSLGGSKQILMFADAREGELNLSDARIRNMDKLETWVKAGNSEAERQLVSDRLIPLARGLYRELVVQNSLKAVRSYFYTLGILSDMWSSVREYTRERNLFLIGDTSRFLKGIIGGSQVPFIYERTGNRYHHIMLDEFQDTSLFQYDNFKPLLENSIASGYENLVVGDVKQSIYRWRNSDWKILGSGIEEDFAHQGLKVDTLKWNYRSREELILFNNSLFTSAASLMAEQMESELFASALDWEEAETEVARFRAAYKDVEQKVPENKLGSGGHVAMHFLEGSGNEYQEEVLERLPVWVSDLQDRGLKEGQIAILVRNSREGAAVADRLLEYAREGGRSFRIISNDSLLLVSNTAISFLMALFRYSIHPDDQVNAALARHLYLLLKDREDSGCYMEDAGFDDYFPAAFSEKWEALKQLPAFELCEQLISIFDLGSREEDLPYLQAFQDLLLDRQRKDNSSLAAFLEYWEEYARKHSISVSEAGNAIRIMTIHKAKGLEFEAVIVPFCNWSMSTEAQHDNILWCSTEGTPLNATPYVPVKYRGDLVHSWFAPWYYREKLRSYMDNLNLLYVACTRARGELILGVSSKGSSRKTDAEPEFKKVNDLLLKIYNEGEELRTFGVPIQSEEEVPELSWEFATYPVNAMSRGLRMRTRNDRYFLGEEAGTAGTRAYGNLMHEIFSGLEVTDDLEGLLDSYVREGLLPSAEKEGMEGFIASKLQQPEVSTWFNGSARIFNERTLLCSDGQVRRPDRVMLFEDRTLVVDFKFGEQEKGSYRSQVTEYMLLLKQMGYQQVEGCIWYVVLDKVEEVRL